MHVSAVLIYQSPLDEVPDAVRDPALLKEALQRLSRLYPDRRVYINRLPDTPEGAVVQRERKEFEESQFKTLQVEEVEGDLVASLAEIFERTRGDYIGKDELETNARSIAVCYNFYPLLDGELTAEIQATHFKYLAHYTYSENIPDGLIPDFASQEFIDVLQKEQKNPGNDLRAFVFKNINKYDVEVFYRLPDLRQYRLNLSLANERGARLVREILAKEPNLTYGGLEGFLLKHPEVLRPFPSYFELEPTTRCELAPVFLPEPSRGETIDLSPDDIETLLDEIQANAPGLDTTICLGGAGEPLHHPDILAIIEKILALKNLKTLYLETYGYLLDEGFQRALANLAGVEKLEIILRLSTLDKQRYAKLYVPQSETIFERIMDNIGRLEEARKTAEGETGATSFKVYAEMLRMTDVEDEIDAYFERFENSPVEVILQKFNTLIGQLPERRVSNLTPLHREFCWHLARDMYITARGDVPLCKQDPGVQGEFKAKLSSGVRDFLIRTADYHGASVRGEHEKIPMSCLNCDEWYTFNG